MWVGVNWALWGLFPIYNPPFGLKRLGVFREGVFRYAEIKHDDQYRKGLLSKNELIEPAGRFYDVSMNALLRYDYPGKIRKYKI